MCLVPYKEYINLTSREDNRQSWVDWKIEICGMSEDEAIKASIDPEWGYKSGKNLCDLVYSLIEEKGSDEAFEFVREACSASQDELREIGVEVY